MRDHGTREPRSRQSIQRDSVRKGVYILPNLVTSASLFAGFYSIIAAINGDFDRAAWAVVVSMLCDGADGRVARWTHTTSRFGVEYDSLSDLVAFGVAPGILAYQWALRPYGKWGWAAAFIFVICGALRLARFNIQIDNIESVTFNGLPIPVSAGMIVTTILLFYRFEHTGPIHQVAIPVVIFLLAFLMVSNIKFVSFKELNLGRRQPFVWLLAGIFVVVLIVVEPEILLFSIAALYVLHGPVRETILWRRRVRARQRQIPNAPTPERDTMP